MYLPIMTKYLVSSRDDFFNKLFFFSFEGTLVWFCCTTLFEIIEHRSGICSVTKYLSKGSCAAKGFRWRGFDISGTFE